MDTTCISCSQPLKLQPELGAYACANSACERTGKAVQPCEVCRRYAVVDGSCQNATCPTFERPRTTCNDCGRPSLISISGIKVCLNLECRANASLDPCWFCQQRTVSRVQHRSALYTCLNIDCSVVLKLIRPCPVCSQNSFDLHQGRCLNGGCPTAGARVRECPACGKKRYFGDEGSRENKCANPKCSLFMSDAIDPALGDGLATVAGTGSSSAAAARQAAEEVARIGKAGLARTQPTPGHSRTSPAPRSSSASASASQSGDSAVDVTMQMNLAEVQQAIQGADSDDEREETVRAEIDHLRPTPTIGAGPKPHSDEMAAPRLRDGERDRHVPRDRDAMASRSRRPATPGGADEPPTRDDAWQAGSGSWQSAESASGAFDESTIRRATEAFEPARIESVRPREGETRGVSDSGFHMPPDDLDLPREASEHTTMGIPTIGQQPIGSSSGSSSSLPDLPGLSESMPGPPEAPSGFDLLERSEAESMKIEAHNEVDFHSAFKYLQDTWIHPPGQRPTPLYLVIGLAGVGKTCFLTMLGQVLQGNRFYTPREDIKPQLVRIDGRYRPWIRDLVYDFSSARFDEYISTGIWPPADIPGQTSEFLVTELLTADGDVARLATLEISGEVYQEFLPKVAGIYQDPSTVEQLSPDHRIIWELMQQAEGIVVLLEGSQDHQSRTQIYGPFFQALYQWKSVEVRRRLDQQYERFLELKEEEYPMSLRVVARQFRDTGSLSFDEFSGEVRRNAQTCAQTLKDQGINEMMMRHYAVFDELRMYYSMVDPAFVPLQRLQNILQNDPGLKETQEQLKAYANFLGGFLNKFSTDRSFLEQVYQKKTAERSAATVTDDWPIFQRYVCWHYGLDESELQLQDMAMTAARAKGEQPFERLKYLSITFTKTDKDFAIYPASNFPRVVNVDWAAPLPRLGNFLTLCNGYLRYYNSSITGYSVRKDAGFQLGRRGTLTPINIAEPLLDMLTFTGHKDLFDPSGAPPKF